MKGPWKGRVKHPRKKDGDKCFEKDLHFLFLLKCLTLPL
jgi:hypothetical protein